MCVRTSAPFPLSHSKGASSETSQGCHTTKNLESEAPGLQLVVPIKTRLPSLHGQANWSTLQSYGFRTKQFLEDVG